MPSNPPPMIASGGITPNHLDEINDAAATRTNQGSLSMEVPCCDWTLINPMLHSLYTAVYTRPTAPHSTPLRAEFNNGLVRILLQIGKSAVLITSPGKKMAIKPRTPPRTGFPGLAKAPRKTAKFYVSVMELVHEQTKLGPGNAWIRACDALGQDIGDITNPIKKSRDETNPAATT